MSINLKEIEFKQCSIKNLDEVYDIQQAMINTFKEHEKVDKKE